MIVITFIGGFYGILINGLSPKEIGIGNLGGAFLTTRFEFWGIGFLKDLIGQLFGGEIFVNGLIEIFFHFQLDAFADDLVNFLLAGSIFHKMTHDHVFPFRIRAVCRSFLLSVTIKSAQKNQCRDHGEIMTAKYIAAHF